MTNNKRIIEHEGIIKEVFRGVVGPNGIEQESKLITMILQNNGTPLQLEYPVNTASEIEIIPYQIAFIDQLAKYKRVHQGFYFNGKDVGSTTDYELTVNTGRFAGNTYKAQRIR
jgi:hypothetical protein